MIEINALVTRFTNYGTITNGLHIPNSSVDYALGTITNYGEMHGIWAYKSQNITINNLGVMKAALGSYFTSNTGVAHFVFEASEGHLTIQNFMVLINESQSEFNGFTGYKDKENNKNSHFVIWGQGSNFASFKDGNSKIILDFGSNFELGKEYTISKLVTDKSGTSVSALNVDFSRLTTRTSLYKLTQSGDNFIANIDAPNSEIGSLYKANIRTMNNFWTLSNSMIYPRKHNLVILRERSDRRISNIIDSANHLKSYESFAYRNEAVNRRIQRQNKRNYSRKSLKLQNLGSSSLRASEYERGNPQNQRFSQNPNNSQTPHDYYFILTPFVNHNLFFESGRYNLSGFDYGFLTAFSARVAESNSLGAHFMMSYGSLGNKKDKDFIIKSLNLNLGLNYKLDLIYDMFVKARGDFYYFLNQAKTLTMFEAVKPNNLGFGISVSYGKDFDFKSGGVLGIEAGLDYKALQSSTISLHDNVYQKSLYHLLYADVGVSYAKYFGGFGINLGGGFRANLAPKLAESALIVNTQTLKFTLDNDKYLGYANAGISYVLNARDFDMEFSLAYYGNFGDKAISNAGGFEWRVGW